MPCLKLLQFLVFNILFKNVKIREVRATILNSILILKKSYNFGQFLNFVPISVITVGKSKNTWSIRPRGYHPKYIRTHDFTQNQTHRPISY